MTNNFTSTLIEKIQSTLSKKEFTLSDFYFVDHGLALLHETNLRSLPEFWKNYLSNKEDVKEQMPEIGRLIGRLQQNAQSCLDIIKLYLSKQKDSPVIINNR